MNSSNLREIRVSNPFHENNKTRTEYHLSPETGYIFLVIEVALLVPMCFFHYLIWKMIKREKKKKKTQNLIKNLLSCYVFIVPITFLLVFVYINILTKYVNPPKLIRGHWFCAIFESLSHATIVYIGGFSVFVACIKYWFIVHSANAINFGEKLAKNIFLKLHLIIPTTLACLNSVSNGKIDQIFWVDHCWSYTTSSENMNDDIYEKIRNLFCVSREYEITNFFGEKSKTVITTILRAICGSVKTFYLLFLSNLLEFTLYVLIFRYLNR